MLEVLTIHIALVVFASCFANASRTFVEQLGHRFYDSFHEVNVANFIVQDGVQLLDKMFINRANRCRRKNMIPCDSTTRKTVTISEMISIVDSSTLSILGSKESQSKPFSS